MAMAQDHQPRVLVAAGWDKNMVSSTTAFLRVFLLECSGFVR